MSDPRVPPLAPPFEEQVQATFEKIMPPGVPPLSLFTTLARVPRVWERFRGGSLLDRGALSLRQREIIIDRTCARRGCAYEWGVHIAFFAERAKLTPEQVQATARGRADDAVWTDEERLLLGLVDELCDTATVSDALWEQLSAAFTVDQMLEAILLVGFYHSVSFLANALKLAPEPYAAPFPSAG
jgi:alkylhydroperoxidase family enzyme